jgi:hypothetical protein
MHSTEASKDADCLHQDRTRLHRPRQVPIGADEGVAPECAGDDEAVFGEARCFTACGGLRDARESRELADRELLP